MTVPQPQSAAPSIGHRIRRIAARLALAAIAGLIAIKLSDLVVGWSRDSELRHRLRLVPNAEFLHQSDEVDYTYHTNRLRLHGPVP